MVPTSSAVRTSKRLGCIVGAGLAASLGFGIETADAQGFWYSGNSRPKRVVRQARPERAERTEKAEKVKDKAFQPQPVHLIVISIPKQRISAYGGGGFHAQSSVSSGRTGFPTPIGVFSVIQKNRYHRSNIYSGAPMPFMQRITWSGVAMHEGVLPGYPASHGCIRLTHKFASELWGMTRMGVRVVVTPDDAEPVQVTHAKLPAPNMTPAPTSVSGAEQIKPSLVAMAGEKDGRCGDRSGGRQAAEPARSRQGREDQAHRRGAGQGESRQGGRRGCGREGGRGQQGDVGAARGRRCPECGTRPARRRHQGRGAGQDAGSRRARQGGPGRRRSQGSRRSRS